MTNNPKRRLYDVCDKIYHALEANAAPLNLKYALTQLNKEPTVSIETGLWQMFVVAFEGTMSEKPPEIQSVAPPKDAGSRSCSSECPFFVFRDA